MIETLEGIDRAIVLAINGWNSPFLDQVMWILSKTAVWIPAYAVLLYLVFKQFGLKYLLVFTVLAVAMIALVDSSTTFLFKETIQRYRPSHHLWLTKHLHFHTFPDGSLYQGGQYGFFSSHASNNAAIACIAWLCLRHAYPRLKWILIASVSVICYSRIYLAVHYFTDVLAGVTWGILWGIVFYRIFKYIRNKTIA
jgi:undecaprenyl-diphosphatase